MHCAMTSRHLDFGPPPKVKVSPRVLPKVLRVLLKAEARREKDRSPAFAQAKASLESALARSLNRLVSQGGYGAARVELQDVRNRLCP